ncbi:hypothetical protein EDI_214500 [Entamoeba dispar SAW760]|uniref:Uncharacterized protein n=1 Tax=Entamoeba dispar (strain ATCC PRA-260 / SAW760) TaxID=370354 RepID=B0ETZ6_ENTDS|nr:uncharacterized protein EDI_214500 [Entamoeba dispar SAW760]EDR21997.1 hypothetical protein EDI_214500 [Entamoeba dispar SAW760]|eukprot:EDR21997.1 hypothetical protein EDI_214500 [Entamoeba dispar SAW760]
MNTDYSGIHNLNNNNDGTNNDCGNIKPFKSSFIIKANSITGKPTKDLEFNNIEMSQSRISDVKKAIQRFHSLHPKISCIEIRKDDDPNQIPIDDNTYLYTLGDFEYLYATFTTPLSINENLSLLIHVRCLKKIVTIHFTFDRQHSSKFKPLLTFFLSLYPYWNPYDPQHNTIIDETETNKTEQQNHQEMDPNARAINENNENEVNDIVNDSDNEISGVVNRSNNEINGMDNNFIVDNEGNNQEQEKTDNQFVAQN